MITYMLAAIFKIILSIVCFSALLGGCAIHPGGPTFDNDLLPRLESGYARVVVFRDESTFINSIFFRANILIDGEVMLSLPHKSFDYIDTPAGYHEIDLQWQLDFNRGGPDIILQEGEIKFFRVTSSTGWFGMNTSLVIANNDEVTLDSIKSCCRLVSSK